MIKPLNRVSQGSPPIIDAYSSLTLAKPYQWLNWGKNGIVVVLIWPLILTAFATQGHTQETPSEKSVIGFSAERKIKQIDWFGQFNEIRGHISSLGMKVRIEKTEHDPTVITLFDYKNLKEYRIYEHDRIFFESDLSNPMFYRARREGLIQAEEEPHVNVVRLSLGKTVWEDHPCEIVLKIRTVKIAERSVSDYTLLWEALDLDHRPVRVAYQQSGRVFAIVEYHNAKKIMINPALFELPADYLNFTPY